MIIQRVFRAKRNLRVLFGSKTFFRSPLTSTDDYMDWSLRKLIVQKASGLHNELRSLKQVEERLAGPDPDQDIAPENEKNSFLFVYHVVNSMARISFSWQRASMKNLILSDETSLHNEAESIFKTNDTNTLHRYSGSRSNATTKPGKKEKDLADLKAQRERLREFWDRVASCSGKRRSRIRTLHRSSSPPHTLRVASSI